MGNSRGNIEAQRDKRINELREAAGRVGKWIANDALVYRLGFTNDHYWGERIASNALWMQINADPRAGATEADAAELAQKIADFLNRSAQDWESQYKALAHCLVGDTGLNASVEAARHGRMRAALTAIATLSDDSLAADIAQDALS